MKFIDKINRIIGNFLLLKRIKDKLRPKSFHNLESAKSIGILFDARNENKFTLAKSFIKYFTDKDKTVTALGFVDNEDAISYYLYRKGVDFFCLTNVGRNGRPKNTAVTDFINNNPDILINIGLLNDAVIQYIMSQSAAKLKISGLADDKFADFVIDVKDKKEITYLIEQVKHYLQIIRKA